MPKEITFVDLHPSQETFLQDVLLGLSQPQKKLSPKYLYDEKGAQLFDKICTVEEYYPTRTEMCILASSAVDLNDLFSPDVQVIELGSGGNRKIREILNRTRKVRAYTPIDISRRQLIESAVALKHAFPPLDITAICGDYMKMADVKRFVPAMHSQQMFFFPGSTLGNLDREEGVSLLRRARTILHKDDYFMIGLDLLKDVAVLKAAYNDSAGVTAQFNLNLLERMNRELGANFEIDLFRHEAIFNASFNRIEMHIVSKRSQKVAIQGHEFTFAVGESIHTESSHKFSWEQIRRLAQESGFEITSSWTDTRQYFAEVLFKAA